MISYELNSTIIRRIRYQKHSPIPAPTAHIYRALIFIPPCTYFPAFFMRAINRALSRQTSSYNFAAGISLL